MYVIQMYESMFLVKKKKKKGRNSSLIYRVKQKFSYVLYAALGND